MGWVTWGRRPDLSEPLCSPVCRMGWDPGRSSRPEQAFRRRPLSRGGPGGRHGGRPADLPAPPLPRSGLHHPPAGIAHFPGARSLGPLDSGQVGLEAAEETRSRGRVSCLEREGGRGVAPNSGAPGFFCLSVGEATTWALAPRHWPEAMALHEMTQEDLLFFTALPWLSEIVDAHVDAHVQAQDSLRSKQRTRTP